MSSYKQGCYHARDVQKIAQTEGVIVDASIEWRKVGIGKVVVICRMIGISEMEVMIIDNKDSWENEKKRSADLIFSIRSYSHLVRELLIPAPVEPYFISKQPLWCHV